MGWLSDTFDKVFDDPFNLWKDKGDKDSGSSASPASIEPILPVTKLGANRSTAMQDALARNRLGIGNSRGRSRHVNPVGSNPKGSNISKTTQGGTTPAVQTGGNPPAENITPASATLPAGRYSYLDLVLQSDVPITPDNPLYSIFNSKFARRL